MENIQMEIVEGADTRPMQVNRFEQMTQFVNNRVYKLLAARSDANEAIQSQEVMTTKFMQGCVDATTNNLIEDRLRCLLVGTILRAYKVKFEDAFAVAKETVAAVREKCEDSTQETTPEEYEGLEAAFKSEYIGTASVKFKNYLERCWATQIWEDNQGAIALAQNAGYHARTKHVDIRHHFIRETIEDGTVAVAYVDTKNQLADILTKALGSKTFKFLRDANGIKCKDAKQ